MGPPSGPTGARVPGDRERELVHAAAAVLLPVGDVGHSARRRWHGGANPEQTDHVHDGRSLHRQLAARSGHGGQRERTLDTIILSVPHCTETSISV